MLPNGPFNGKFYSESLHISYSSYTVLVLRSSRKGVPYRCKTGDLHLSIFSDAFNSNSYGIFLKSVKKINYLPFKK